MFDATRRSFLSATSTAFGALVASGCVAHTAGFAGGGEPYGPLIPDPAGFLDLPGGFSYSVISRLGDVMDDGEPVPDKADGMGCFALAAGMVALVRNHELRAKEAGGKRLGSGFDRRLEGEVLVGGTTTVVLDSRSLAVGRQFRSLAGTIRNCAGGTTPWGSWLSCEEDVTRAGDGVERDHGWIFEVPASATKRVEPVPLTAMGRFNHEAAAVDPATGIVYLTEDREDGLLYRFLPDRPGELAAGGRLQALAVDGIADSRNWAGVDIAPGAVVPVSWIDLDDVQSPNDDLRKRGAAAGAMIFARGEGIHMGKGELYFCCTSGGAARFGQVFRLTPSREAGDRLDLFFESTSPKQFNYGDNLTIAPNGHLIVCEDQYTPIVDNHLRGITPAGVAYPLARLRIQTELAGACFTPDGQTLFVNAYSPTATLAIRGPWVS